MKYCSYCGAALLGSAVSFCSECGKPVPSLEKHPQTEAQCAAAPQTENKPAGKAPAPSSSRPLGKQSSPKRPPPRQQKTPAPRPPAIQSPKKRQQPPPKANQAPPPWSRHKKKRRKRPEPAYTRKPDPRDIDYDGYYDDVQPEDDGYKSERMDPEVIKRIGLIVAGALVLMVLSVVIMYVL